MLIFVPKRSIIKAIKKEAFGEAPFFKSNTKIKVYLTKVGFGKAVLTILAFPTIE